MRIPKLREPLFLLALPLTFLFDGFDFWLRGRLGNVGEWLVAVVVNVSVFVYLYRTRIASLEKKWGLRC